MTEGKSFWTTLPGILAGIASIITALGGLLYVLYEIGVIGPKANGTPSENGQERVVIEERIREIDGQIAHLRSEIESLLPESESNPDIETAIREKERNLDELEREKRELEETFSRPPDR